MNTDQTCLRLFFRSRLIAVLYRSSLLLLLIFRLIQSQTIITEINRDPEGPETELCGGASHEFVELTNIGSDSLFIDSLFISDGMESDQIIVVGPRPILTHEDCIYDCKWIAPGKSALIIDKDYIGLMNGGAQCRLPIRSGTVLLTISDSEIGNGLASDDGVFIYKGTKDIITEMICSAADSVEHPSSPLIGRIKLTGNNEIPEGVSIIPVSVLFDKIQYGRCGDSLTPGWFEPVKNGWLSEWKIGPMHNSVTPCTLAVAWIGGGESPHEKWKINLNDGDKDQTVDSGLLQLADNRCRIVVDLPWKEGLWHLKIGESDWLLDLSVNLIPSVSLKINEIFPRAQSQEPEWFELVNKSQSPINLNGWLFGNGEDTETITQENMIFEPGSYVVVTKDASLFSRCYPGIKNVVQPQVWHTLDNFNDTLFLRWPGGLTVDTVCWSNTWFVNWTHESLERIDSSGSGLNRSSWELSSRKSPGMPNDASFRRQVESPSMEIGPIPFTPNSDGKNDFLSIELQLPSGCEVSVTIYDFRGKEIRSFGMLKTRKILWDGRCDNGHDAPVGPIFVVAKVKTICGDRLLRMKGVLWR